MINNFLNSLPGRKSGQKHPLFVPDFIEGPALKGDLYNKEYWPYRGRGMNCFTYDSSRNRVQGSSPCYRRGRQTSGLCCR